MTDKKNPSSVSGFDDLIEQRKAALATGVAGANARAGLAKRVASVDASMKAGDNFRAAKPALDACKMARDGARRSACAAHAAAVKKADADLKVALKSVDEVYAQSIAPIDAQTRTKNEVVEQELVERSKNIEERTAKILADLEAAADQDIAALEQQRGALEDRLAADAAKDAPAPVRTDEAGEAGSEAAA